VASPFLSKDFKHTINTLRDVTLLNLKQEWDFYSDDWDKMGADAREYATNDIQLNVIDSLKEIYDADAILGITLQANQWVRSKEGILRQYLRTTEEEIENRLNSKKIKFVKQRYVKVVAKCNSEGTNTVEEKQISEWVDELAKHVSTKHKDYLLKPATRRQIVNNLVQMIAFPVSIKKTSVDDYIFEDAFLKDMQRDAKYIPESAKKSSESLVSLILVTLNGVKYSSPNGKIIEEVEVRIKSSEAEKMAKYTVGKRMFPHHDGVGAKKKILNTVDIPGACKNVISAGLKGDMPTVSYRFKGIKIEGPYDKQVPLTKKFLEEARQCAEDTLMQVLKNPYVNSEGEIVRSMKSSVDNLVTGAWIDMKMAVSKAPMEVQVKDEFSNLIYTFNSPLGHNSIDYDSRRNEICTTKLSVYDAKSGSKQQIVLPTQLILDYQVKEILIPAFTSVII
jgi:hypothetical protein